MDHDEMGSIFIMNEVISWTAFITVGLFEGIVFYKLRFKMDKAAIFLLLIYLTAITERLVLDVMDGKS